MINKEIYEHTTLDNLKNVLSNAIAVMSKSTNKLILVLRDKTDISIEKDIEEFSDENHIGRVNLGLQLSRYLIENDVPINDYLTRELKIGTPLIVDNAEILFDSEIAINAFTLFKSIARHQILIVVLDGRIGSKEKFIYGTSSNKDFSQYEKLTDTYIIDLNGGVE